MEALDAIDESLLARDNRRSRLIFRRVPEPREMTDDSFDVDRSSWLKTVLGERAIGFKEHPVSGRTSAWRSDGSRRPAD
ncbi:MAG TPA: hypothetical protein VIP77_08005 [Jiangellaceae bacterium]